MIKDAFDEIKDAFHEAVANARAEAIAETEANFYKRLENTLQQNSLERNITLQQIAIAYRNKVDAGATLSSGKKEFCDSIHHLALDIHYLQHDMYYTLCAKVARLLIDGKRTDVVVTTSKDRPSACNTVSSSDTKANNFDFFFDYSFQHLALDIPTEQRETCYDLCAKAARFLIDKKQPEVVVTGCKDISSTCCKVSTQRAEIDSPGSIFDVDTTVTDSNGSELHSTLCNKSHTYSSKLYAPLHNVQCNFHIDSQDAQCPNCR